MKKFLLPFILITALLLAFTACSESEESREYTDEDDEIISAVVEAANDAVDDGNYGITVSGLTVTYKFNKCTYTETSAYDESELVVVIASGSTIKYVFDSSDATSGVMTYDFSATVDGTAHTVYIKCSFIITSSVTSIVFDKVKLDGVVLTGIEGATMTSLARSVAAEAVAE